MSHSLCFFVKHVPADSSSLKEKDLNFQVISSCFKVNPKDREAKTILNSWFNFPEGSLCAGSC